MTPYSNIYSRAIGLFDDPSITRAFLENVIKFSKIMYTYLRNAIPMFDNPMIMEAVLSDRTEPSGYTEVFDGNDSDTTFELGTEPTEDASFEYKVGDESVDATYNSMANSVTFAEAPIGGIENISVEWYSIGCFNNTLSDKEERILAELLVSCWGEKEKNFLLDIRRLLNDSDFKIFASNIKQKQEWHQSMLDNAKANMNQYAWQVKIRGGRNND